jgi:hypothetical protein
MNVKSMNGKKWMRVLGLASVLRRMAQFNIGRLRVEPQASC